MWPLQMVYKSRFYRGFVPRFHITFLKATNCIGVQVQLTVHKTIFKSAFLYMVG